MEQTRKIKQRSVQPADAAADIALINQFALRELKPEEVYCFSVTLCDNEVDRDFERFPDSTLAALAPMFVGKSGISDHDWSAGNQIARVYRTELAQTGQKNSLGQPLVRLRASAYIFRSEETRPIIEKIESGILKEVSVGCAVGRSVCSVCGKERGNCEHIPGREYGGKSCYFDLMEPKDAYEWSFVAVPAQRGAGVSKSMADVTAAFALLQEADLAPFATQAKALIPKLLQARQAEAERLTRAHILQENKRFLEGVNET